MLKFEIVSSRTVEGGDKEKKYVSYTVQVRQESTIPDKNPIFVERRYTHFLELYNGLKKECGPLMNGVLFPKKVVLGNFDPELIAGRSAGFESLLDHFSKDMRLRECNTAMDFFQNIELMEAKRLMAEKKFDQALYILETSFKLLSKVYTDRSHVVLLSLCRLVACGAGDAGGETGMDCIVGSLAGPVEKWATLALRRYEGVSDADLLQLYVPLLQTCLRIWQALGKDTSSILADLENMRKKGMRVDNVPGLMDSIINLEKITSNPS